MNYLLGLDLGTGGIKAVLFDERGVEITEATQEYPLYQLQNGWSEQDPEDWYQAMVKTVSQVVEQSGIPKEEILGIGISGQMMGAVLLDERGDPLRKAILWNDQRTEAACAEVARRVGEEKMLSITCNPPRAGLTAAKIYWVKQNEPDIYAKCRHILLPKDYLRYRLTGEFATEVSDASAMQLMDVPNRCWSGYILDALEIKEDMLGKVYESYEVTGTLRPDVAKCLGLCEKTVVVGGAGDNAAASVGTGVVAPGRAMTTIGTSGVVFAYADKPAIDPKGRVYTFCTAVPGAWHMMGLVNSAGLSLKWYRNNFYPSDEEYLDINADAAQSPVGANRLIYLPYLMGECTPHLDLDCRGAFIGLSNIHTRKDMTRAVMEGVSFGLKESISIYDEIGVKPALMRMCGGGSKSPLWRQMLSDIFEIPVCLPDIASENSAALGAAILASVGTGLYPSVVHACDQIITLRDEQYTPDSKHSEQYRKIYDVYREMYPGLKDAYKSLAGL